ncbi:MAG: integrase domain-containing protein [Sideroxydans sp.]|nr:integrase domain-containing protein [Sideroxydans sp.]
MSELFKLDKSAIKLDLKPGRLDGKNSEYKSGAGFIPKKLNNEIEVLLQMHKDLAAHKEKKVGQGTQDKRRTVIKGFFADARKLKFKIESVHSLKEKHLHAVFRHLESQGQSPSTIQNKISIMRVFCEWIGKPGMVRNSAHYVDDKASVTRTMVAREDKSWDAKGVDIEEILEKVRAKDQFVAIELELCLGFGLRVKEAMMLRPLACRDGSGEYIHVREGTKGDRPRVVPIENAVQRKLLDRAVEIMDKKTGFLGGRGKTLAQKRNRFYYVLKSCGVTLSEQDISAHGLRHQYMQESFRVMLGIDPPVKGGDLSELDPDEFHVASQKLMERAGHTRVAIGASYYGSRRIQKANPEYAENQSFPMRGE